MMNTRRTPSGINSGYISGAKQQPQAAAPGTGGKPDAFAGFKTIDDYPFYSDIGLTVGKQK